jgi:AcrR family transcriptional regulator
MGRKGQPIPAGSKQKRQSPDDRRREFVAIATEFFSDEGFGGGARGLARRPGVTQPLLYRHFPSKDDLIREVYRMVYLDPLETGWEKLLTDRTRSLHDRLLEFYRAYTDAISTRKWLYLPPCGPEGARYQPMVCRHDQGHDPDPDHSEVPP